MLYDMVFEGGGAKGMVFVGALQELDARGHTPARLLGTSAGSIMATFLAAGYQMDEMLAALTEQKDNKPVFMSFLQNPPPLTRDEVAHSDIRKLLKEINLKFVPDFIEDKMDDAIATALTDSPLTNRIFSFVELGGFYAAQNFRDWLKTKLNSGVYPLDRGSFKKGEQRKFGDMTLAEFFDATGVDLSLVASNTSESELLILNHRTAPDCPVVWGVRMSMSFPLLWQEVVWQPEWGKYRGRDISGDTVVDGGMLSNFPIELFISDQPQVTAVMGDIVTDGLNVLGFLIDEKIEVPGAEAHTPAAKAIDLGQLRPVVRVEKLINTMTQAHDKSVIEAYEQLVVRLPAKGYGTIEFDMSGQRRDALIAAGRQATADYFNRLQAKKDSFSFGLESSPEVTRSAADKIAGSILFR